MRRFLPCIGALLVVCGVAQAQDERVMSFDFPAGHSIQMKLAPGGYVIHATTEQKVSVRLSAEQTNDLNRTWVKFTTDKGVGRLETKDAKNVKVIVEIPARSDLNIRLGYGELSVKGIEGHKEIHMSAGEINIDVGDPSTYRDVSARVRIGEVQARPFRISKSGFFRSFKLNGSGRYGLRATVGVGEINFL